jgi:hypothetical protein
VIPGEFIISNDAPDNDVDNNFAAESKKPKTKK